MKHLEVVMVLDNTGSMSTNDNIGTLRNATSNFIEILFESVNDPDLVKVGLVPYASSVNVGPYGLGLTHDGLDYGDEFVIPPEDDEYAGYYNGLNQYTGNSYGIDEDDLEYDTSEKGQWHGCVLAEDNPLDEEDHSGTATGATLGNFGMAWGYRVLSPEQPFIEGAEYDDEQWDKVALVMTDGVNTMSNVYSAYGLSNEHNIDANDLDDRFAETCSNMKDEGILIYAVTFDDGVDEDTKDIYRDCATLPTNFHDAPDQATLEEVFEQIARELSNLYIKQ